MNLMVKLFARAAEIAGTDCVELQLPESATVGELRDALAERYPEMLPLVPRLLVAVGADYADDSRPVPPGAEVACFPPVSGG